MPTKNFQHRIKTNRKLIAVCEIIHHYSVIDGEVNDSSSMGCGFRIPVTLRICNVPLLPAGDSASFTLPIMLDYTLEDVAIKKAIGIRGSSVEIDSDGMTYHVNQARDSWPLYDVRIERWEEVGEND